MASHGLVSGSLITELFPLSCDILKLKSSFKVITMDCLSMHSLD